MEDDRTYGVELEFASALDKPAIIDLLNRAFADAGLPNEKAVQVWRSTTKWVVKHDGSIDTEPGFGYQIEINSRVLKGDDDLAILKLVCEAIAPYAKINSSCGLHVHHGLHPDENPLDALRGWMMAEKTIYECLPLTRKTGRPGHTNYAGPVSRYSTVPGPSARTAKAWWGRNVRTRYVGMNLESHWVRSTVEVRAGAGTVEFEKIKHWAELTQRLVSRSCKNRGYRNFQEGIDNLARALGKDDGQAEMVEVQEQVSSSGWTPKAGTRFAWLYEIMLDRPISRSILANRMATELNMKISTAKLYITDWLGEARRQGLNIQREGEMLHLIPTEGGTRVITRMVARPIQNSEPDEAVVWLKKRHEKFYPRHQVAV